MRIAVHSASTAVRHALESAIELAGHSVCEQEADFLLIDGIHPLSATISTPGLTLVKSDTPEHAELFLGCPTPLYELIVRLEALGKSSLFPLSNQWVLDIKARQLTHPSFDPIALTEKECRLLHMLVEAATGGIRREQLLSEIWGIAHTLDTHTLETHVYRLRTKLEHIAPSPGTIVTEASTYRWTREVADV